MTYFYLLVLSLYKINARCLADEFLGTKQPPGAVDNQEYFYSYFDCSVDLCGCNPDLTSKEHVLMYG